MTVPEAGDPERTFMRLQEPEQKIDGSVRWSFIDTFIYSYKLHHLLFMKYDPSVCSFTWLFDHPCK